MNFTNYLDNIKKEITIKKTINKGDKKQKK